MLELEARRCFSRTATALAGRRVRLHRQASATPGLPLGATHATRCTVAPSDAVVQKGLQTSSLRDQRLSGTKPHGASPSDQSETIPQKPTCASWLRSGAGMQRSH